MSYKRLHKRTPTNSKKHENEENIETPPLPSKKRSMTIESEEEETPTAPAIIVTTAPAVETVPQLPELIATSNDISTLDSFLRLYNYNVTNLHVNKKAYSNLRQPLTDLSTMIGMHKLKQEILIMTLYYLKNVPEKFTEIMEKRYAGQPIDLAYDADEDFHTLLKKSKIQNSDDEYEEDGDEEDDGLANMDLLNDQDSFIDDEEEDWDPAADKALKKYARQLAMQLLFPPGARKMPEIPDLLKDADNEELDAKGNDIDAPVSGVEDELVIKETTSKLDMLHTIICGSPGTGKSHVAQYIGNIYAAFGFLNANRFNKIGMADLIAGYTGQTTDKTRKVCQKSLGGVLFLDEAYALGRDGKGDDDYGREAADTFTDYLTTHKHDFVMIVAGYEEALERRFFSLNQGLRRRFQWKFTTNDYTPGELKQIFEKMVANCGFGFSEDIPVSWFQKNYKNFPSFGGSMESLLAKVKYAHTTRSILLDDEHRNKINILDMNRGLEKLIEHGEGRKEPPMGMYL